jgi:FAD/FMN-containing dehydrogenase
VIRAVGFSWLTNLHGLTVDTVVGFEIVLPSGRILSVDANHNSDLFWGLKGGLNNFVRHALLSLFDDGSG